MKIALVTGANRGLGLETCKKLSKQDIQVIFTCRDREEGAKQVQQLKQAGFPVEFLQLDVTDVKSIEGLAKHVRSKFGQLDILVNNAGIFPKEAKENDVFRASPAVLKKVFETNTLGAFMLCQAFIPLMQEKGYGRVVNISSGMGQLSGMDGGYPAYRISKTALNAVTRIFAEETKGTDILVNSVCPGWVRTDMGGEKASRSIDEGVSGIVWAATLPKAGPTGGFFRDGEPLSW